MDGSCDEMATAAMGHSLLFDAFILFVKHRRDKGGTAKLMSGGGGGGEAVGSNEEGDISKTEGGGAGFGPPHYFTVRKREKKPRR